MPAICVRIVEHVVSPIDCLDDLAWMLLCFWVWRRIQSLCSWAFAVMSCTWCLVVMMRFLLLASFKTKCLPEVFSSIEPQVQWRAVKFEMAMWHTLAFLTLKHDRHTSGPRDFSSHILQDFSRSTVLSRLLLPWPIRCPLNKIDIIQFRRSHLHPEILILAFGAIRGLARSTLRSFFNATIHNTHRHNHNHDRSDLLYNHKYDCTSYKRGREIGYQAPSKQAFSWETLLTMLAASDRQ